MTISQQFAEFGTRLCWDAVPEAVQRQARLRLLDMLGVTIAGAQVPTSDLGAKLVERYGAIGVAGLIGRTQRTSAPFAALVNSMACHALEMDDGHHYAVGLHNGCTTIPASLAVGEEANVDLERLLAAVVLGYEIAGRIGTVVNPAHRQMGFHTTGTVGVFGATAAAAFLRGLDNERYACALGIAGSASAGTYEFLREVSTSKLFHGAHAAMSGVLAADLAGGGLTGPLSVFEGRDGFFNVYGRQVDAGAVVSGLGEKFDIQNAYIKLHAACGQAFSTIDAVLELRKRVANPAHVESMVVRTYRAAAILNDRRPHTRIAAKFSIPYCAAVVWQHGRATEDVFSDSYLVDPALLQLAGRIETIEDPEMEANFPRLRETSVAVVLGDGSRLESYVDVPRGMGERPASDEVVTAKFRALAAPVLGPLRAEALLDVVLSGRKQGVRELVACAMPQKMAS